MLQHILVAPAPIFNPNVPLDTQKFLVQGEEKGQHYINPNMMLTCKLYYKEGLNLLYNHNTFMYTECWTAFSYTLSETELKERQEAIKTSPPPSTRTSAFQTHAANIQIRLPFTSDPDFLDHCEKLVETTARFPNLRTLTLDFLNVSTGYQDQWDENPVSLHSLHSTISDTLLKLQHPTCSAGPLREIALTGLPRNDLSLYIVRQYARLLAANGRIAVGWGEKGRRYALQSETEKGEVMRRDDLVLARLSRVEVGEWVLREHRTSGSKWLFGGLEDEGRGRGDGELETLADLDIS